MIKIENKLRSSTNILIPNDLSKIVSYVRVTPKIKVPIFYNNFSNIDNTPKKNTTRNIQINYETSNLNPKAKLKIDKNLIKKYKDKLRIVDDYSKDITSKKKKSKTKNDKIIKNTLKKYNKPKKSILDVIELPKPLVI